MARYWPGLLALAVAALIISGIIVGERDCISRGGMVVVVSENQAKGTMNHTECRK